MKKLTLFTTLTICLFFYGCNKGFYRAKNGEIVVKVSELVSECISDSLKLNIEIENWSQSKLDFNMGNAMHFISLKGSDSIEVTAHPSAGHYHYNVKSEYHYLAPGSKTSIAITLTHLYFYALKPNSAYTAQLVFSPFSPRQEQLPDGFKYLTGDFKGDKFEFSTCDTVENVFKTNPNYN